ncbi:hypothetical protein C8J57DRAFT_1333320 [Mycena rebaudengoi]|nr:hypothetical protein C8J57DRAFT_1333320 [Mycena rebaudengoi]
MLAYMLSPGMFSVYITLPLPSRLSTSHHIAHFSNILPFHYVLPLVSDSVSGSRCSLLRPIALYFPYPRVLRTNFAINSAHLCTFVPRYIFPLYAAQDRARWFLHRTCVDALCAAPTALRENNLFPQLSTHACEASAVSTPRFHHISLFLSFPLLPRAFLILFSIDPRVVHPPRR